MKIIGILLIIGAAVFAFLGFDELSRAATLDDMSALGGVFSAVVEKIAYAYFGIAATAALTGFGFLIAPARKAVTLPPAPPL